VIGARGAPRTHTSGRTCSSTLIFGGSKLSTRGSLVRCGVNGWTWKHFVHIFFRALDRARSQCAGSDPGSPCGHCRRNACARARRSSWCAGGGPSSAASMAASTSASLNSILWSGSLQQRRALRGTPVVLRLQPPYFLLQQHLALDGLPMLTLQLFVGLLDLPESLRLFAQQSFCPRRSSDGRQARCSCPRVRRDFCSARAPINCTAPNK